MKTLIERRDAEDAAALNLHAGHNAWQYTRRRVITRSFETHHAIARDITFGKMEAALVPRSRESTTSPRSRSQISSRPWRTQQGSGAGPVGLQP